METNNKVACMVIDVLSQLNKYLKDKNGNELPVFNFGIQVKEDNPHHFVIHNSGYRVQFLRNTKKTRLEDIDSKEELDSFSLLQNIAGLFFVEMAIAHTFGPDEYKPAISKAFIDLPEQLITAGIIDMMNNERNLDCLMPYIFRFLDTNPDYEALKSMLTEINKSFNPKTH